MSQEGGQLIFYNGDSAVDDEKGSGAPLPEEALLRYLCARGLSYG